MDMVPSLAAIRDGMRIEMRPKVILLGSEMRAEQTRAAKLELEKQIAGRAQTEITIEIETQKEIAEIKVNSAAHDEKRKRRAKRGDG